MVKKLFLIILTIMFLTLIVLYFLRSTPSQKTPVISAPTAYPVVDNPLNKQLGPLRITSIFPPETSPFTTVSRNQEIHITFNKPVIPAAIQITTSPSIPLSIIQGSTTEEVYVSPVFPELWNPTVLYTVRIERVSKAIDGTSLLQTKEFSIKSFIPKEPAFVD